MLPYRTVAHPIFFRLLLLGLNLRSLPELLALRQCVGTTLSCVRAGGRSQPSPVTTMIPPQPTVTVEMFGRNQPHHGVWFLLARHRRLLADSYEITAFLLDPAKISLHLRPSPLQSPPVLSL